MQLQYLIAKHHQKNVSNNRNDNYNFYIIKHRINYINKYVII